MAERPKTIVYQTDIRVLRVKWETLANGDTGEEIELNVFQDRSVQVVGTFGTGGSVSILGSNDGGTTWSTLRDPLGNNLTFTAAGLKAVMELPHMLKPHCTAGDGTTDLDVWLHARGNLQ